MAEPLERVERPEVVEAPAVDWRELARADRPLPADDVPADTPPLLDARALDHLDRRRAGVPVADLRPDRLDRAGTGDADTLRAAYEADPRPDAWIDRINPGFEADVVAGRAGRTENCAECARAVQATLDGRPTAAAAISADGLNLAGEPPGGGEHPVYTEQWAGRRAETATYDQIGARLADTKGSAIVFAFGETGHATNAHWDAARGEVRWLDGQLGVDDRWPPAELRERFPRTTAIFFPSRSTK